MNSILGKFILIFFVLISCQEKSQEEENPRQKIAPNQALKNLRSIISSNSPDPEEEIERYCNYLDIPGCLEILTLTEGGYSFTTTGKICLKTWERLGQLDHLLALQKIDANSPKDFEEKGHSFLFIPESIPGMISIIKGWAKTDLDKATKYALKLTMTQDVYHEINWDIRLSNPPIYVDSLAYFLYQKHLSKNPVKAYDFLLNKKAYFWSVASLRCYATHCELPKNKAEAVRKLEKAIQYTTRNARTWLKERYPAPNPDIKPEIIRLEFANNWSKSDFTGALDWWSQRRDFLSKLPEAERRAWFFRFGSRAYTPYQKTEFLAWLKMNTESWSQNEDFSIPLSRLVGEHLPAILNLIESSPKESKRSEILRNLILRPEKDEGYADLPTIHFSSLSQTLELIRKIDLSARERELIETAFQHRESQGE